MIKTVTFLLKSVGRNKQESSKANINFYIADQFKTIRNLNFLTILVETDSSFYKLKGKKSFPSKHVVFLLFKYRKWWQCEQIWARRKKIIQYFKVYIMYNIKQNLNLSLYNFLFDWICRLPWFKSHQVLNMS